MSVVSPSLPLLGEGTLLHRVGHRTLAGTEERVVC